MSFENTDSQSIPAGAAFVASASGSVYYWVGSSSWHRIPPLERVWFPTEEAAREAGYRPSNALFERLDEFEMLGELGRGGTSIVYHARDRALGREVAIKVIQACLREDQESLARFAQEARLLAGLRHPNIVSAFSVKQLRGGGLALVMEYVDGPTLRDVIRESAPLPADRAEWIITDVAEALSAAHQSGIIHRDVKPDNVFLERKTDRALLADFGIAMHLDNPSGLTMAGAAVGTPNYMSPEQIDGRPLDGRSDLYSLALIAWEMLTGIKPWDGESLYSVIYKQKHEDLPSLRELRPDLPPRLTFAIEGALAKEPEGRWKDVDEFLQNLRDETLQARWRRWSASTTPWRRPSAEPPKAKVAPTTAKTVRFRREDATSVADPAALSPAAVNGAVDGPDLPALALGSAVSVADPDPVAPAKKPRWRRTVAAGMVMAAVIALVAPGLRSFVAIPEATLPALPRLSDFDASALERPVAELAELGAALTDPLLDLAARAALLGDSVTTAEDEPIDAIAALLPAALASLPAGEEPVEEPLPAVDSASPVDAASAAAEGSAEEVTELADASDVEAEDEDAPAEDLALSPARSRSRVAPGGLHTCGVSVGGSLICWGGNDAGQLGGAAAGGAAPVTISAVQNIAAVEAGAFHTCALDVDGDAYCWGENREGQLGERAGEGSAPAPITGNRFYSLTLGTAHTCGIGADMEAYCWGSNTYGQLGDGSRTSRDAPMRVWTRESLVYVAAGWTHTCGLTSAGIAYCWGRNSGGQLGDGTTEDHPAPVQVAGDVRFRSLAAGSAHTCGIGGDGLAYCWGQNADGRLGDGSRADRHKPVRVAGDRQFVELSAGGRHTCGLTRGGVAYCWGHNNYGQLGTGDTEDRAIPTRVQTDVMFTSIRSRGSHTCGVALDGSTYCWGYNVEGQVGDGTRSHRTTPSRVARTVPVG